MCRCLTILLLLTSALANADTQGTRIGYVDMKHVLDNAPQVQAVRERLDQEFRPRNDALMADETRLERMRQSLQTDEGLDSETRFSLEREIRNLARSIERRRDDLREEISFRTNAEKQALEEDIRIAIQAIAERDSFDLILTIPVAYASESINITGEVLEFLEVEFEGNVNRRVER